MRDGEFETDRIIDIHQHDGIASDRDNTGPSCNYPTCSAVTSKPVKLRKSMGWKERRRAEPSIRVTAG